MWNPDRSQLSGKRTRRRRPMRLATAFACALVLAGCTGSPTTPDRTSIGDRSPAATASATASASAGPTMTASSPTPVRSAATSGLAPTGPTQLARVVRVLDGDTIEVTIGGSILTVRYIGMDTPESVAPGSPVEWMGPEASAANAALVDGRQVVLERDVSEMDRYGRLLRDVWVPEADGWLLVGLELVRLGYAQVSTYPPDVKYVDGLLAAQTEAREAGRGLWGATPPPTGSPAPTDEPAPTAAPGDCDPAYPGVCIPPLPPDLDCADVPYRDFAVLPPDPHRFDGDRDGIGCES